VNIVITEWAWAVLSCEHYGTEWTWAVLSCERCGTEWAWAVLSCERCGGNCCFLVYSTVLSCLIQETVGGRRGVRGDL
jgi:hypothetical protein